MHLLIVTQKVDRNDSGLGFFHRWIEECAKYYKHVTVICLEKGVHNLPINVTLFSLGKDDRVSRIRYVLNFYRFVWHERKNYDIVFVHMNQEYVLLGGILWRLLGKKIALWRNHPMGNSLTWISVMLSHVVLCTSSHSYTARFSKTISDMPVGIDTRTFFDKGRAREGGSILSIGRISPIKNVLGIIQMVSILTERGWTGNAYIYGSAPARDRLYEEEIRKKAARFVERGIIHVKQNVSYDKIADIYNDYELYVNLTPTGSFDKAIFEAMACGMMVLVSNQSFIGKIPAECICHEGDMDDLVEKAQAYCSLSHERKKEIIARLKIYVETKQSLHALMVRLPKLLAQL